MFFQWFSRGKSSLGLLIICICSLFCSYSLLACSIAIASEGAVAPEPPSVEDFAREADIIAIGTVIAKENDATARVVKVQYYLKGSGPHEIRIAGFDWPCSDTPYFLAKGHQGIFFATGDPTWTLQRVRLLDEGPFGQNYDANDQESIKKILRMTGKGVTEPSSGKTFLLWGTGAIVLVTFLFLSWRRQLKILRRKLLKRLRSNKSRAS